MRPWWPVACMVVALASSGCLVPMCGPSKWSEPGLPAWLHENGAGAGFERYEPTGFPPGPRMAAALPAGARLSVAEYSKPVGRQMMHLGVDSIGVSVSADGPSKASVASVLAFVNNTLDEVYRGDAATRETLLRELAAAWAKAPRTRESSPYVSVNVTTTWDFDGVFWPEARFTRDSVGSFVAYSGERGLFPRDNWLFTASIGSWGLYGQGAGLGVDDLGHVEMGIGARNAADAKAQARAAVPGYDWVFEDFHFGGACPFAGP